MTTTQDAVAIRSLQRRVADLEVAIQRFTAAADALVLAVRERRSFTAEWIEYDEAKTALREALE